MIFNSYALKRLALARALGALGLLLGLVTACAPSGGGGATEPYPSDGSTGGSSSGGGSNTSAAAGTCSSGPTSVGIRYFLENPKTSSSSPALSFTTTLNTSHTQTTTLTGLNGDCVLQNDHMKLTTDSLYPSNIVKPTTSSLYYYPSQPEFRQLGAFYYASSLKTFMEGLGVDLSGYGHLAIDANCSVASNAYFSPSTNKLCLGYYQITSSKKVWAADDADVVVHETGHSMNRTLASTSILNSTGEAGAIDEAIADYWALTLNNDAELSEWFLGALGAIRDATQNQLYPNSMIYEVHYDSRVLTQVLWDLRQSGNLGKTTTDALVKRALQLLPATTRFSDFYQAFYDASGPSFLNLSAPNRALIVTKFTAKGLHRVDAATGMRLSMVGGSQQTYVMDDYSYSFQSGGNCNGQLDVGETALVLVNLENTLAARLGTGVATLGAMPAGTQSITGGQVGEFFRFNASTDFVSSLPAAGSNRDDAVYAAAFVIRATSSGVKNFSLTFKPMYADATGVTAANPDVTVNFSLTVGTAASSSGCDGSALWP